MLEPGEDQVFEYVKRINNRLANASKLRIHEATRRGYLASAKALLDEANEYLKYFEFDSELEIKGLHCQLKGNRFSWENRKADEIPW